MKKTIFKIILSLVLPFILAGCGSPETELPTEPLELSIRNILEMPAYEQIYRDIVYIGEKERVLFFTTTDKEVLFSVDIMIQAGIKNAGLISIEITGERDDGTRTAVVSIPESEIILADADEKTIEQYFIREKGEGISRLEYYDEINRKKEELVKSAVDSGILEQADANCRNLIKSVLRLSNIEVTGFREVESEE